MPVIPNFPFPTDDTGPGDNGTYVDLAWTEELEAALRAVIYGTDNPGVSTGEIVDEVVEARDEEVDLDARITRDTHGEDNPSVSAPEAIDEVVEARDDNPSLDDRLNNFVADEIPDADADTRGLVSADGVLQEFQGVKLFFDTPQYYPGAQESIGAIVSGSIVRDVTDYTAGTAGAETDAFSVTLQPDTLENEGDTLRLTLAGKTAAGGSTRTVRIYWNGSSIFTHTFTVASGIWQAQAVIQRGASANAQRAFCRGGAVTLGLNTATPGVLTNVATVWDNLAANLAASVVLKVTLEDSAAAGNVTETEAILEIMA